jgi:hypothetical protein
MILFTFDKGLFSQTFPFRKETGSNDQTLNIQIPAPREGRMTVALAGLPMEKD